MNYREIEAKVVNGEIEIIPYNKQLLLEPIEEEEIKEEQKILIPEEYKKKDLKRKCKFYQITAAAMDCNYISLRNSDNKYKKIVLVQEHMIERIQIGSKTFLLINEKDVIAQLVGVL